MSSVLAAMGVSREVGLGAIRFSLGRNTASSEIDIVVEMLANHISGKPSSRVLSVTEND